MSIDVGEGLRKVQPVTGVLRADIGYQRDHGAQSQNDFQKYLKEQTKGLQDYLNDDPSLTEKKTYEEMQRLFCETD